MGYELTLIPGPGRNAVKEAAWDIGIKEDAQGNREIYTLVFIATVNIGREY
ncbi:unnamed protein product [marine sediment metagenome]|uniref:Uncharacterized protein n=1 Tax=marine sediment metagenome TaxID=412755 RepID=X0UX03_9ZZZZ